MTQSPGPVFQTNPPGFGKNPNTPTRMNNTVRYYRVDKEGNKIEIDGPLTPSTPLTPITAGNSMHKVSANATPQKTLAGANNSYMAESRMSLTFDDRRNSASNISQMYPRIASGLNQSMVANSIVTTPIKHHLNAQSPISYKLTPTDDAISRIPGSPLIPPLKSSQQISTPFRDYQIKNLP